MIAELTGICQRRRPGQVVINVHGIGFAVNVPQPLADSLEVGQEVSLHTQLVVRENDMSLVGFSSANERDLFNTLVNIQGIGVRLALNILTAMNPTAFVTAVLSKNLKELTKVHGLGKKGAQRLLLEMENKITKVTQDLPPEPVPCAPSFSSEAKAALISFGCSEEEAERALQTIAGELAPDADTSDIVMAAMRVLN